MARSVRKQDEHHLPTEIGKAALFGISILTAINPLT
jgi:hypothetical protein